MALPSFISPVFTFHRSTFLVEIQKDKTGCLAIREHKDKLLKICQCVQGQEKYSFSSSIMVDAKFVHEGVISVLVQQSLY